MRDALWSEAHASPGTKFSYRNWTIEGGRHLDLQFGDQMAAELSIYWTLMVMEHSPSGVVQNWDMVPRAWLSEGGLRNRGSLSQSGNCYSFDESFGSTILPPRVVSYQGGFEFVQYDVANPLDVEKRKKKPGFEASKFNATLEIDTLVKGSGQISIGYLRTYASEAVAELSCIKPCVCKTARLQVHTSAHTSTTVFSPKVSFVGPEGISCHVQLRLVNNSGAFKFISLQTNSH